MTDDEKAAAFDPPRAKCCVHCASFLIGCCNMSHERGVTDALASPMATGPQCRAARELARRPIQIKLGNSQASLHPANAFGHPSEVTR